MKQYFLIALSFLCQSTGVMAQVSDGAFPLDESIRKGVLLSEQSKSKNQYTMDVLYNFYWEGYNMEDPDNFTNIINSISIEDVALFTKKVLKGADSYEMVVKPKI